MRVSYAAALLLIACSAEAPPAIGELSSAPPRVRGGVNGAPRKVALRSEQGQYLTVQRAADGTLRTRCVHGDLAAQQSLSASAPPLSPAGSAQ